MVNMLVDGWQRMIIDNRNEDYANYTASWVSAKHPKSEVNIPTMTVFVDFLDVHDGYAQGP